MESRRLTSAKTAALCLQDEVAQTGVTIKDRETVIAEQLTAIEGLKKEVTKRKRHAFHALQIKEKEVLVVSTELEQALHQAQQAENTLHKGLTETRTQ